MINENNVDLRIKKGISKLKCLYKIENKIIPVCFYTNFPSGVGEFLTF